MLHGIGGNLVVTERPVDLSLLAELEVARDRRLEEELERGARVVGGLFARLHPMADHAADPVAGEGAVFRVAVAEVFGRGGDGADLVGRELPRGTGVVDVEL